MSKHSKKSEDDLDIDISDDEDIDLDALDLSDMAENDSLLSLEFKEIESIELDEKEKSKSIEQANEPKNLLNYAKELLKKSRHKATPKADVKVSKKTTEKKDQQVARGKIKDKLDIQFSVIEL